MTTTNFQITLDTVSDHQKASKKLQVNLLSQMMDATNGKRGMEEILELARWASALPGLSEYVQRMLSAKQETLKMNGLEIGVAEDVPMQTVQEMLSLQNVRPARIEEAPVPDEVDEADDEADYDDDESNDDDGEEEA